MKIKSSAYVFCKFHNELDYICEKLGYVSIFNKRSNEFNLVEKANLHDRIYIREYDAVPPDVETAWEASLSYVKLLYNILEWFKSDEAELAYEELEGKSNDVILVQKQFEQELAREKARITLKDVQRYDSYSKVVFTYGKPNQTYMKYIDIVDDDETIKTYLAINVDDYYQNPSLLYLPKWLQLVIKEAYINGDVSIPMEQLNQYGVDKKELKRTCSEYDIEALIEVFDDGVDVDKRLPECF
ncbi:MAG: hypothetical protein IKM20_06455 [Erysipelotrichales bacterium]|nr:hypothetical protein [Erysipelotrichales bacterium]